MYHLAIILISIIAVVQLVLLAAVFRMLAFGRRGLPGDTYPVGYVVAACFSFVCALGWTVPGTLFEWIVWLVGNSATSHEEFIEKISFSAVFHLIAGSYVGFKLGAFIYPQTGSRGVGLNTLASAFSWYLKIVLLAVILGILIGLVVEILTNGFRFEILSNRTDLLRTSLLGTVDGIVGAASIMSLAGPVARRLFTTRP